jgi:hypothetical protein
MVKDRSGARGRLAVFLEEKAAVLLSREEAGRESIDPDAMRRPLAGEKLA